MPIHTKDSKLNCSNYRLISRSSNIDKTLESIMHNTLHTFLEKKELIYTSQFGFRQKHSIVLQLIHLTELIRKQLDGDIYGCGIFVDFQEAFDTVDHVLKALEYYSIRGISNK